MSRLQERFQSLRAQSRTALIPFITAGDPHPDVTVDLMHALVAAGADALELGVPFTDPMADGPVIQAACERALAHNVSLRDVLKMVTKFREDDAHTPLVLMGYLNPIERMGVEAFALNAAEAGLDALIPVDLALEEASGMAPVLHAAGLDTVFLLAPTTSDSRMAKICAQAQGFVYYVSLKGVTGSASMDVEALGDRLVTVRKHTKLPVAVGFGIRTPENAAAVSRVADAVVVGSALVSLIGEYAGDTEQMLAKVCDLLARMRQAMDETSVKPVDIEEQNA